MCLCIKHESGSTFPKEGRSLVSPIAAPIWTCSLSFRIGNASQNGQVGAAEAGASAPRARGFPDGVDGAAEPHPASASFSWVRHRQRPSPSQRTRVSLALLHQRAPTASVSPRRQRGGLGHSPSRAHAHRPAPGRRQASTPSQLYAVEPAFGARHAARAASRRSHLVSAAPPAEPGVARPSATSRCMYIQINSVSSAFSENNELARRLPMNSKVSLIFLRADSHKRICLCECLYSHVHVYSYTMHDKSHRLLSKIRKIVSVIWNL